MKITYQKMAGREQHVSYWPDEKPNGKKPCLQNKKEKLLTAEQGSSNAFRQFLTAASYPHLNFMYKWSRRQIHARSLFFCHVEHGRIDGVIAWPHPATLRACLSFLYSRSRAAKAPARCGHACGYWVHHFHCRIHLKIKIWTAGLLYSMEISDTGFRG